MNWKHIRTLNGSQSEGFEEFCSQLARREPASRGSTFTRKGKPDAGIECYRISPTGEESAWQAKYFLSIDNSQWSQLDDSVNTALEKHPRLIRYYVCVPLDLPDARLADRRARIRNGSAAWRNGLAGRLPRKCQLNSFGGAATKCWISLPSQPMQASPSSGSMRQYSIQTGSTKGFKRPSAPLVLGIRQR